MEKEKLFYDLHQTIKDIGLDENNDLLDYDTKLVWISKLTGVISQMNDATLNMVLDIYTRLTSYSLKNLEFIIMQADELEYVFYTDGEVIEKNLILLYEPYIQSLMESPIITLHCLNNNILGDEVWNCVLTCICFGKNTIENLILNNEVSNRDIINSLPLLFKLNAECSNFAKTINDKAGPLHKMQMDIHNGYTTSYKRDARNKYLEFLVKNMRDEDTINRVIEYINTHDFNTTTSINEICELDVNYSDEIKNSSKSNILMFPAFKVLYKTSPKIAERLFELYSTNKLELKEFENLVHSFIEFNESQTEVIEKLL